MQTLDYITKRITRSIEADGTISNEDKIFIKGKIAAEKYKIEEDLLQFKKLNCDECQYSECVKKPDNVLHCLALND